MVRKLFSGWKFEGVAARLVYRHKQLKLRRATYQVFVPAMHVVWQHGSVLPQVVGTSKGLKRASVDGSAPIGYVGLMQVSNIPRPPVPTLVCTRFCWMLMCVCVSVCVYFYLTNKHYICPPPHTRKRTNADAKPLRMCASSQVGTSGSCIEFQ